MAKEKIIKIEVQFTEEQLQDLFDARDIKYKKKYFAEILDQVENDFSIVEEALGEMIDEIINENYEE